MVMTIVWPSRSTSASGIGRAPPCQDSRTGVLCHTDTCLRASNYFPRGPEAAVRTPLCDRLGIELPIFAFTHCRDVVAAVARAGGFGVLGAVGFSPEQLEVELKWIDEHVGDRPYGVDIVIPGKYEGMGELDPVKLEQMLLASIPEQHRKFAEKVLADA